MDRAWHETGHLKKILFLEISSLEPADPDSGGARFCGVGYETLSSLRIDSVLPKLKADGFSANVPMLDKPTVVGCKPESPDEMNSGTHCSMARLLENAYGSCRY